MDMWYMIIKALIGVGLDSNRGIVHILADSPAIGEEIWLILMVLAAPCHWLRIWTDQRMVFIVLD